MKKNRKLGTLLLFIIFLPGLFFSVYEIGSLNQNEKIIKDIYGKQLDIILFSVNQYSDDVASSLATKLNNAFANPLHDLYTSLRQFTFNHSSIKGVFYIGTMDSLGNNVEVVLKDYSLGTVNQQNIIRNILLDNSKALEKLNFYIRSSGYRKIEAFNSPKSSNLSYFVFITDNYRGRKTVCGIIIDAKEFVNQVLSPKIQEIVEERFIISVLNEYKNETIYTSEPTKERHMSKVKPLWFLPHFKLGIVDKSKTIEQMVRERTYLNFGLIILLDILFLIGTWYVFRSIKTQIQLAQMRADFISNVSHEIRTPLALISLYIETILLGRLKTEKLQEYYQVIYQETTRLTGIVNKILNFSRIEEKKYNYNFVSLDLNETISSVIQRYDYQLKNFTVEIKLQSDLPDIHGDREAIYEVFMNLLDNAIKYSKEEKFISITSGIEGSKILVEVSDRGIGIPENQQKYIFDKFFRVTDGEVQSVRGSGLGLSIVKHIMEGHNAIISLSSMPGNGCTFKLIFPVSQKRE